MPDDRSDPVAVVVADRPLSALPPVGARIAAFLAILVAGLAGAAIGYALTDLQCSGDCSVNKGFGILVGGVLCAGGTAVVAVLALRAMGEWREIADRERAGHAPR